MTVADRIAVMDKGQIVQVASPAEIYGQPCCRYVAEFIGNVNIFDGTVTGRENGMVRLHSVDAGGDLLAPESGLKIGGDACIAVRPEEIELSHDVGSEPGVNHLTGVVSDIGYFGSVSTYHVRLESGKTVISTQTNRSRDTGNAINPGDPVHLSWPADASVTLTS